MGRLLQSLYLWRWQNVHLAPVLYHRPIFVLTILDYSTIKVLVLKRLSFDVFKRFCVSGSVRYSSYPEVVIVNDTVAHFSCFPTVLGYSPHFLMRISQHRDETCSECNWERYMNKPPCISYRNNHLNTFHERHKSIRKSNWILVQWQEYRNKDVVEYVMIIINPVSTTFLYIWAAFNVNSYCDRL